MILHEPDPTPGVLAASVTVVNPQVNISVWSGPALAAVGNCAKLITTSSVEDAHGLFAIVHLKVYEVPATPVNVDVGLAVLLIEPPAPEIILQEPVPNEGVFAARVTVNEQVPTPL